MKRFILLVALLLLITPLLAFAADTVDEVSSYTADGIGYGITWSNGALLDGVNDYIYLPHAEIDAAGWSWSDGGFIVEFEASEIPAALVGVAIFKIDGTTWVSVYYDGANLRIAWDSGGALTSYTRTLTLGRHVVGVAWTGGNIYASYDGTSVGSPLALTAISGAMQNALLGALDPAAYCWPGWIGRTSVVLGLAPSAAQLDYYTADADRMTPSSINSSFGAGNWLLYPMELGGSDPIATDTPSPGTPYWTSQYIELSTGQMAEIEYRVTAGDFVNGALLFFTVLLLIAILVVTLQSARSVD